MRHAVLDLRDGRRADPLAEAAVLDADRRARDRQLEDAGGSQLIRSVSPVPRWRPGSPARPAQLDESEPDAEVPFADLLKLD
jgi:hypothetical protein